MVFQIDPSAAMESVCFCTEDTLVELHIIIRVIILACVIYYLLSVLSSIVLTDDTRHWQLGHYVTLQVKEGCMALAIGAFVDNLNPLAKARSPSSDYWSVINLD